MIETKTSFCRLCHAACPIEVDIDHDEATSGGAGPSIVAVRGDRSDPLFEGYTCIKGRQLGDHHQHESRLRRHLRRTGSTTNNAGTTASNFEPITATTALDEIAASIRSIIDRHGPRSVATYIGTGSYQNSTTLPVATAWHAGIGSPSIYTSLTIDQPAHRSAALRMGGWEAGWHNFSDADVVMAIGYNAPVSSYGPAGGLQGTNPIVRLRRAKENGLRLIVIDPRHTELAAAAELWLQVQPGEDPTLLAGIIRVILDRGLHDKAFCADYVQQLEDLERAVDRFSLGYVSERAKLPADDIVRAAELFAEGPRGSAGTGTGPNMAPHGTLTEHLALTLNAICGRVNRVGDQLESGYFLFPGDTRRAQVTPPTNPASGTPHRVRGLAGLPAEMLSNALADEILLPGDGQVRALIVSGGNPVVAFPDQAKTIRAMQDLELLVVIDHRMTPTAEFADYVIAPRLQLERADVPHIMDRRFALPYSNYSPAVIDPSLVPGTDLLADWEVFAGLAARNNSSIDLPGGRLALGTSDSLSDDVVLDHVFGTARMPMAEIRANRGTVHPERAITVVAGDPDADGRLAVAPPDVVTELHDVLAEKTGADHLPTFDHGRFPFRLVGRRLTHVLNSMGRELPGLAAVGTTNHVAIHPDDLKAIGGVAGDHLTIASPHGQVIGIAESTRTLKRGVVAMPHSWGGSQLTDEAVATEGSPTNRLVSNEHGFDPITGMAIQSAIPVSIAVSR